MYILNGAKTEICATEYVERFCLADKKDAALVLASYGTERPPVTLGRYGDMEEARGVLNDMLLALGGGQAIYYMPESRYYAQETIKRDARTKRKGGS